MSPARRAGVPATKASTTKTKATKTPKSTKTPTKTAGPRRATTRPRTTGGTRAGDDAAGQLARMLAIIPRLAVGESVRAAQLAAEVGTTVDALLEDIARIAKRADDLGGWVDPVQFEVDGTGADAIVTLSRAASHFLRPMRLTVAELRALELGLAMEAAERPAHERRAIRQARERLATLLATTPTRAADARALLPAAGAVAPVDEAHAETLARLRTARRERRAVAIAYQAGEATAAAMRTIHPYALVTAHGHWYCIAWCTRSAGLRNFRLDRILHVDADGTPYTIPDDFSPTALLGEGSGAFVPTGPVPTCTIRYSARIARWLAEREGRACDADGSLTCTYPLADTDWAVRHVLQYGGEAEAIEPPALRAAIAARLDALSAEE